MARYETSVKIVGSVLANLRSRSGCDLEEIIDDEDIYEELVEDLYEIVDRILCNYWEDDEC